MVLRAVNASDLGHSESPWEGHTWRILGSLDGSGPRYRGRVHVLRIAGTPAEKHFPLAALHRLVPPMMSPLGALGAARGETLRSGFGDGHRPDIFTVALAALNLLANVAADAPLALLVDDSHWLDQSSGEVLALIAGRIDSDSVFLLAAGPNAGDDPLADGTLPELSLGGLDPVVAAAFDSAAPGLPPLTRRRLLADADGKSARPGTADGSRRR